MSKIKGKVVTRDYKGDPKKMELIGEISAKILNACIGLRKSRTLYEEIKSLMDEGYALGPKDQEAGTEQEKVFLQTQKEWKEIVEICKKNSDYAEAYKLAMSVYREMYGEELS